MNETIGSRLARAMSEPVAPVDTPGLGTFQHAKVTALARHPAHLKAAARRRLPRAIFDFVEGGSHDEVTLKANRADLEALRLSQRVFDHAAAGNQRTTIFGQRATIPVALAPIGLAGVIYPRGEIHAARAAHAFGVPFCLSTLRAARWKTSPPRCAPHFYFSSICSRIGRSTRR
jgi:L-lactate dehydrogenase (cytochrome)